MVVTNILKKYYIISLFLLKLLRYKRFAGILCFLGWYENISNKICIIFFRYWCCQ